MSNYAALREEAFKANLEIPKRNLAMYTWGNVSAFDPSAGVFAIKPSGIPYDQLTADSMVVLDLEGAVVWGTLRPSSDTPTHHGVRRQLIIGNAGGFNGEYSGTRVKGRHIAPGIHSKIPFGNLKVRLKSLFTKRRIITHNSLIYVMTNTPRPSEARQGNAPAWCPCL